MVRKSNNDIEYSVKEIIKRIEDKQERYHEEYIEKMDALIVQTTKTNGRVNTIESQQKGNIESFTREKDIFAERLKCLEADNKMFTWKIAGIVAASGIIVSLVMMMVGKFI